MESLLQWVGVVITSIVAGIIGGAKLRDRAAAKQTTHLTDDETPMSSIGAETARALIERAEKRLQSFHSLRNRFYRITNRQSLRIALLERDMAQLWEKVYGAPLPRAPLPPDPIEEEEADENAS